MYQYDIAVIGGGPGGYVAAIRAATTGKKVALIEEKYLGGTCLNTGCIPSKTLLKATEFIDHMKKATDWGIKVDSPNIDFEQLMKKKDEVIQTLRNGIQFLIQSKKITLYNEKGYITGKHDITLSKETITAEHMIIATGSVPAIPTINGLSEVDYHTTDTIFTIKEPPTSIVIIGGGVIGVEIAFIFAALNTKVTIIEAQERILATEDEDAAQLLYEELKRRNINVLLKQHVIDVKEDSLQLEDEYGDIKNLSYESLLIATGRKPNISVIDDMKEIYQENDFISVNENYQTNIENIYAIGDVIGNVQLAHVATKEGMLAVDHIVGRHYKTLDYSKIPNCIYSDPQVATIGKKEFELVKENIPYKKHVFELKTHGMSVATGVDKGFTKILMDEKHGEILGVTIVADQAVDLIGQINMNINLEGTIDEIADVVQPHPSMSEAFFESANYLIGLGIHT